MASIKYSPPFTPISFHFKSRLTIFGLVYNIYARITAPSGFIPLFLKSIVCKAGFSSIRFLNDSKLLFIIF